jgi:hypothetical protein
MTEAERQKRRDRLEAQFGHYRIRDFVLRINRLIVGWDRREEEAIDAVRFALGVNDFPIGNLVVHSLAADAARLACAWSLPDVDGLNLRDLPGDEAVPIIAEAWQFVQNEQLFGNPQRQARFNNCRSQEDLRVGVTGTQRAAQRTKTYRCGQAALMFGDVPVELFGREPGFPIRDLQDALRRALGCDLRRFLGCMLQIQGISVGENPRVSVHNLLPSFHDRRHDGLILELADGRSGLHIPVGGRVLECLAASPREMEDWIRNQIGSTYPDERLWLDGPNPLRRYPLVRVHHEHQDHCVAPVPSLLDDWLYEPMMDRLYEELPRHHRDQILGDLHEAYVGHVANLCDPGRGTWTSGEAVRLTLPRRRLCVDWFWECGGAVVLVEAKRCYVRPTLVDRIPDGGDWERVEKTLAGAMEQTADFWRSVTDGLVAPLSSAASKQPVALLVTHGDVDTRVGSPEVVVRLRTRVGADLPTIPTVIISLHLYEIVMSAWHQSGDPNWLPQQLLKAATEGTKDLYRTNPGAVGPLWDRFSELVHHELPGLANTALVGE